jgi:PEP-CTERM motif
VTRRVPVVATMLTLAMVLLVSPANADPIRITGGSMVVDTMSGNTVGTVDIHGTQGFRAQLLIDLNPTNGPWHCACDVGTTIDIGGFLSADDGAGIVELNGASYIVPSPLADVQVHPSGGSFIAPPLSTGVLVVTMPFEVRENSSELLLFDFQGEPTVVFSLVGRGVATLELTPNRSGAAVWDSINVHYDFESAPVPEPATLFLFGTGAVALAARRHRRRARPPEDAI